MNKGEYFKIETVEELKQAYEMFKDEWWKSFTLEEEIKDFKEVNARHIVKDEEGNVYLNLKDWIVDCEEIPSPLKKKSPRQIVMIEDLMDTPLLKDEFILVEPGKINKEQEKLFKGRHFMLNCSYNQIDFWWDTSSQYKHYHYKRDESIIEKTNLKEKPSLQKTLEIGELNIHILKALTTNNLVDSSLTGSKAQEIVDKIEELSRIILK